MKLLLLASLVLFGLPLLAAAQPNAPVTPVQVELEPDEFYNWAVEQNQQSLKAAAKYTAEHPADVRKMTVTEKTDTIQHRFGGGVGVEGFGGNGGYAGYGTRGNNNVGQGNYIYNYGFGFNRPGNASRTTNATVTKTYDVIFKSNAYYGPSVTFINPRCPPKRGQ